MQFPYKTQAIIGLATALGLGLIALVVVFLPGAQSYGPADLVPADRALLYLENTDDDARARLETLVPSLRTLPAHAGGAAALVRRDDGSAGWVTFEKGGNMTGDASVLALIGTGAALSDDPSFRALARGRAGTGSWLFLREARDHFSLPPAFSQPSGPLGISALPAETRVAWMTSGMIRPLSAGFKDAGGDVILRLQAGNLRAFLGRAYALLGDDAALAYETALRTWFMRSFGSDLSLAYDFAPLLSEQSSLTLVRTGSGTRAVLEGRSRDAGKRLETLHAGFRSAFGGAERVTRTFDEEFETDSVRTGSDTTDAVDEFEGWSIRSTTRGTASFHSARNGDRFMVSNDLSLLRRTIEAFPLPVEDEAGTPVARGELAPADALELLRTALPGEDLPLPASLLSSPLLRWELLRTGDLAVLRVF